MLAVEDMRIVCAKYMARHYLSPNYTSQDIARREWIEGFAAFLLGNPTFRTSVWVREFCRLHHKEQTHHDKSITGVKLTVVFEDREWLYLLHNLFNEEE